MNIFDMETILTDNKKVTIIAWRSKMNFQFQSDILLLFWIVARFD